MSMGGRSRPRAGSAATRGRRRVRALRRRVELEHAPPVERRVLRQTGPRGLVERRTPVGAGAGQHTGPRPVARGGRDDALAARGQPDRGLLLGIRAAEGNVGRSRTPADHVSLVPAVDAGAQRLGVRRLVSARDGGQEERCERDAEAATPGGGTQGSSRRSLRRPALGMPPHHGSPSRPLIVRSVRRRPHVAEWPPPEAANFATALRPFFRAPPSLRLAISLEGRPGSLSVSGLFGPYARSPTCSRRARPLATPSAA